MSDSVQLDQQVAHRWFAVDCFNRVWALIDKPSRTIAEDEAMVLTALASLWHWSQRDDCTDQNLSIGHWLAARVFALVGQGENAMRHARRSLEYAADLSPFYVGYAHEAIARAARTLGESGIYQDHLTQARRYAAKVEDAAERKLLEDDLQSLG